MSKVYFTNPTDNHFKSNGDISKLIQYNIIDLRIQKCRIRNIKSPNMIKHHIKGFLEAFGLDHLFQYHVEFNQIANPTSYFYTDLYFDKQYAITFMPKTCEEELKKKFPHANIIFNFSIHCEEIIYLNQLVERVLLPLQIMKIMMGSNYDGFFNFDTNTSEFRDVRGLSQPGDDDKVSNIVCDMFPDVKLLAKEHCFIQLSCGYKEGDPCSIWFSGNDYSGIEWEDGGSYREFDEDYDSYLDENGKIMFDKLPVYKY